MENVADRKRKVLFVDSRPVYTRKVKTRTEMFFGSKMLSKSGDLSHGSKQNTATNGENILCLR